jgi:3-hydroxyacyl-CoA dehydrogenase/enoyl-CoA hydratase/3-hydroxybutyryl-CoA epimerase
MADTLPELTHIRFDVDADGVATVLLDVQGEELNTLSDKLGEDLEKVVLRIEGDDAIKAVVLGSAKSSGFMAGADIKVLETLKGADEAAKRSAEAQQGMNRVEAIHREHGKPVIAAIHGPCLGGGLELALACSGRVCSDSPKTKLGVPEVMLGLLPGAGGCWRLPRLVGVTGALDLILTGRQLRPRRAKKLGLVDEVVAPSIVLDVARARALAALAGGGPSKAAPKSAKEHLMAAVLEGNPLGRALLFKKAKEKLLEKSRGNYPAPERALEVVRVGLEKGEKAGLQAEARAFGDLIASPESKALISIFFATQALKKDTGVDDESVEARPVDKVGVLGGGLMGGGIAAVTALRAKHRVRINEIDDAGIARGLSYVRKLVDKEVKRKRRTPQEAERLMLQVSGGIEHSGLANADVVIEAVFEDLELKRRCVRDIEATCGPEAIFASNTSSLPITAIAEASEHPETVIGMHYFSPVEKMPLLEIIVTDKTADWVTATCVELGKAQGKTVIVVRDGTGFYTSRILGPYMNEAAWFLAEGCPVEQLDQAMVDWGFPVGPFVLLDEVGIDVAAKVGKIVKEAFGDRVDPPPRHHGHARRRRAPGPEGGQGLLPVRGRQEEGRGSDGLRGPGREAGCPQVQGRGDPGTALVGDGQRGGALPGGGHPTVRPRWRYRGDLRPRLPALPRGPLRPHRYRGGSHRHAEPAQPGRQVGEALRTGADHPGPRPGSEALQGLGARPGLGLALGLRLGPELGLGLGLGLGRGLGRSIGGRLGLAVRRRGRRDDHGLGLDDRLGGDLRLCLLGAPLAQGLGHAVADVAEAHAAEVLPTLLPLDDAQDQVGRLGDSGGGVPPGEHGVTPGLLAERAGALVAGDVERVDGLDGAAAAAIAVVDDSAHDLLSNPAGIVVLGGGDAPVAKEVPEGSAVIIEEGAVIHARDHLAAEAAQAEDLVLGNQGLGLGLGVPSGHRRALYMRSVQRGMVRRRRACHSRPPCLRSGPPPCTER